MPLRYHKDFILAGVEALIQGYYLRKFGSTYSEYYYGIERLFSDQTKNPKRSKIHLFKTLFVLIVIPYIKRYLDSVIMRRLQLLIFKQYKNIKEMLDEGLINESNTSKLKLRLSKLLCKIYPAFNFLTNFVNFIYNSKYLLQKDFGYYSLDYHVLRHRISRKTEEEIETPGKYGYLIDFLKKYFVFILYLGTKFLEWHFDSNRKKDDIFEKPKGEIQAPYQNDFQESKRNICQICHKNVNIPCCLDTCGYVFCQVCIYDYVQKIKKCPITQSDCTVDNIHKIYVN